MPGDPVQLLAGDHATPEMMEAIRHNQGLDKPLHIQFFYFPGKMPLKGIWGYLSLPKLPVTDRVVAAYPVTIRLTLYSFIYTFVLGRDGRGGDGLLAGYLAGQHHAGGHGLPGHRYRHSG